MPSKWLSENNINLNDQNGSFFDFIQQKWRQVILTILCSVFYAFGVIVFLLASGSLPSGLSAISTTISYLLPYLKPYISFIYLGLNIPLIIIFWKKIKKSFLYLTIIFLISNSIFGFIFGLPQVQHFMCEKIFVIIKDPLTINLGTYETNIIKEGWPIFVFLILALACCSTSAAFSWKQGASTGGTDIIAYYFSTKKKKDVGFVLMILGYIIAISSLLFIYLFKQYGPLKFKQNINGFNNFFGLQTVSSFLYIWLNGMITNFIYPKYKKVKISIYSKKPHEMISLLKSLNYWHSYTITKSKSGYDDSEIQIIESVILVLEVKYIISIIKKEDPKCWISVTPIRKIFGEFNYSKVI